MFRRLLIGLFLITSNISQSFVLTPLKPVNVFPKKEMAIKNYCDPNLEIIREIVPGKYHEDIVKAITSFLPKVDGIGGFILHTNDILINKIFNSPIFSPEIKKSLILDIISISQWGDATGHKILELYYNIVDCLL